MLKNGSRSSECRCIAAWIAVSHTNDIRRPTACELVNYFSSKSKISTRGLDGVRVVSDLNLITYGLWTSGTIFKLSAVKPYNLVKSLNLNFENIIILYDICHTLNANE